MPLIRQGTAHFGSAHQWIVALDGGKVSTRALRLVGCLKAPTDTVVLVTVGLPPEEAQALKNKSEVELKNNCCVRGRIVFEAVAREEGNENPIRAAIFKVMESFAKMGAGPILVMGSSGRGLENAAASAKQRGKGQAPMSSLAKNCLEKCPYPVLLVNNQSYATLDDEERLLMRAREPAKQPCKITVCADDNASLSRACYDVADHVARRGDIVDVVHVQSTDKSPESEARWKACKQGFVEACSKSSELRRATFTLKEVPKKTSIKDTIFSEVEEGDMPSDLLMMGSATLAKPGEFLGSVAMAVAKSTGANILIVKPF